MDADLRHLRYFVAVAQRLSFSRAAEELHIAQPSLSKQIRQLERNLRIQLFRRTSRRVELTNAGALLLRDAQTLLDAWATTLTSVREVAAVESQVLRVGFVASAANEMTPTILRMFAERHPGWRVEMSQTDWQDPTAGLAGGAVDVALLRLPVPLDDTFTSHVLLEEPRCVALASSHPLATSDLIRLDQLLDEPFVAPPEESGAWRDYCLAADQRGGHPIRIGAVAKRPDEWLIAIANGLGIAFTPLATARYYQRPDIAYRPVDGVSGSKVAVVWPKDTTSATALGFVRACAEAADRPT
ncbi:LysR family transcriptional regulator [Pseudonocardia acaciae]|uniref:LysR family transcriptional regulator n=1 Tax=Pseudonocardia acaciae TaxID=551276 RepID=UPI00048C006A|nr:LysR substrate-binding domain-containing protein [Pseudonocardia acaciae]